MVLDLLKIRCSVRSFSAEPIPDDIRMEILEAGRLSPSGGNEQPWKFGVITDAEQIGLISQAAYRQTWITTAPMLIVLCSAIVPDKRGARVIQKKRFPRWREAIDNMDKELYSALNTEEHQTKIAGTHMSLAALEHGIFSTWISMFDVEKVAEILTLPRLCIPSEIIAFGYPMDKISLKDKKPVDELAFYDRFTENQS